MQPRSGSAELARKHAHVQALRSRAQELERKLEIGAYDSKPNPQPLGYCSSKLRASSARSSK